MRGFLAAGDYSLVFVAFRAKGRVSFDVKWFLRCTVEMGSLVVKQFVCPTRAPDEC